jgi:hypothetical protein
MISNIYSVSESANRHGVIIRAGLSASTKFFSHYLSVNNCLGYARVGSSICDSREGVDTAGPTDASSLVVGEYPGYTQNLQSITSLCPIRAGLSSIRTETETATQEPRIAGDAEVRLCHPNGE